MTTDYKQLIAERDAAVARADAAESRPCVNCGHEARDHMVDDEERRECAACMCKQYEAKK